MPPLDTPVDPRVTPNPNRFSRDAEPLRFSVKSPRAWLYRDRADKSSADTELLYGHQFDVHKRLAGWMYGQAVSPVPDDTTPGYVGWMRRDDLSAMDNPSHRIISLKAPIFENTSIKSRIISVLPMGALVKHQTVRRNQESSANFVEILEGYIHVKHMAPIGQNFDDDFVTAAQSHMGLPYIWAGISSDGLDCSGLVQSSLRAAGRDAPRDADMQEAQLGEGVDDGPYHRGDLIFWPGHVGIMVSPDRMIHANAHHMVVATEPLSEAVARIGPVRTVKRL